MRDASAPKLKLAAEIFLVRAFPVLLIFSSYVACGDLKFWFDEWNHVLFFKNWSNKNVSNFALEIIKFIWFNKSDQINLTVY